ncbi:MULTISPECIES: GIY-YIG nuclease family protein [unclassified Sphingomonas]|jgi:predicted GIY-YIG superfamily endonuclease|uniref:GIY-YIG nuclease family protein n=1 Tax=unclassified Sphingomonas TaxID=196159 RepID=UPI0009EB78DE|nr:MULTISPECIES: GIY-YIG nuclease family protein [unclassified Sphingomonas]
MAFWAYILRCADGSYYTGHSDDLDRRIAQHQAGGHCDYTSRRRPVQLVWRETFQTRVEALEAERMVGGWSRAKKEAMIAGNWSLVSHLARPPKERFSTSLETNGQARARLEDLGSKQNPLVSSEVEKPATGAPNSSKSPHR